MLSRYFFQISERKFDRTRKHIRWICLRVIANLQLKFGEKTRNSFFIWHFAIQSITLNYEMLSRYFFQISERKFDRTRKHIRWICLRVIANLQLKFGEKTRNSFFIWHFAIQSITLNYEMLSRYFFQISERKFDRTRKHIRWICLRVIANLQLKFGEKT